VNWLDKAISFVSPSTGLRRVRARAIQEALLAYDAVRSDRRRGGWTTNGNSGNAEIGPAAAKLRGDARDLFRNNAFAKKIVRRRSKRTVGYGLTPQADTGNPNINKIIDEYWSKWVKQCCSDRRLNFYGCQQLIVNTEFISGECLIRLWDRNLGDGLAGRACGSVPDSDTRAGLPRC
jgi:capsid protein